MKQVTDKKKIRTPRWRKSAEELPEQGQFILGSYVYTDFVFNKNVRQYWATNATVCDGKLIVMGMVADRWLPLKQLSINS